MTTSPTKSLPDHKLDQQPARAELVMFLERDQLTADTSHPVPRAQLSTPTRLALWALRIFAILMSAMVIYTFAAQLK
jgi:hypothetical protein